MPSFLSYLDRRSGSGISIPMKSRQVTTEEAAKTKSEILFIFIIYNSKLIILIIMKSTTNDHDSADSGNPEVTYVHTHRSLKPKDGNKNTSTKTTARGGVAAE